MDDLGGWFASLNPNQIGLAGIVSFVILSIVRGWIVPRSVHMDRIADKDAVIATLATERDDWKSAYHKKADEAAELLKQNGDLLDAAEVTNRLLETLRIRLESQQRQIGES